MHRVDKLMIDRQRSMLKAILELRRLARSALRSQAKPNFSPMKETMSFIERCDSLNQQIEERHVFAPVETRQPALARTARRLRRDHAAMKGYDIRLRTFLDYWEQGDPKAGPQTAIVADDFARFCLQHIRIERRELIPAALSVMSDAEQAAAAQAFLSPPG